MKRQTMLAAALLVATYVNAHAQVAADETLRLTATLPSPWGAPLGPAMLSGTKLRLAPGVMDGPAPLNCPNAQHRFVLAPASGWFEGNLPEPAERSARALGLPDRVLTQRVSCANGGFDIHRAADGRAWIGLDNAVLRWERVQLTPSPEAVVQSLLMQHVANELSLSTATLSAQQAWLSTELYTRLTAWFKRVAASDEVPELNGDPYTDSQEPPEAFELGTARVQGARAELIVTYRVAGGEPYPVTFELVRVKDVWRVADLRYRNGERLSQLLTH